jgi:hypothetical protein
MANVLTRIIHVTNPKRHWTVTRHTFGFIFPPLVRFLSFSLIFNLSDSLFGFLARTHFSTSWVTVSSPQTLLHTIKLCSFFLITFSSSPLKQLAHCPFRWRRQACSSFNTFQKCLPVIWERDTHLTAGPAGGIHPTHTNFQGSRSDSRHSRYANSPYTNFSPVSPIYTSEQLPWRRCFRYVPCRPNLATEFVFLSTIRGSPCCYIHTVATWELKWVFVYD